MTSQTSLLYSEPDHLYKFFVTQIRVTLFLLVWLTSGFLNPVGAFDFAEEILGEPGTLSVWILSSDRDTGYVSINGVDTAQPGIPFDVDWGDGEPPEPDWFPFEHSYSDSSKNYVVTVTAHYDGDESDSIKVAIRFISPVLSPISLPAERAVTIDNAPLALNSRPYPGYSAPALSFFDDSFFELVPRSSLEYVLHLAAEIQYELANGDVLQVSGGFQQHVLRDSGFGGMYSLWFTDPVAFGAGDYAFGSAIQYSSFFHEMGHNISLNSPSDYHYGGRIDGNANAIFSETMAQIFAHATSYILINNYLVYGLESLLALELENSTRSSMRLIRNTYDGYVAAGAPFTSWNNPESEVDETFGTFMTIAFKFFEHAENSGNGYVVPLQRMMELLQLFDADLAAQYDQSSNTNEAEMFRSSLMVAALSHAFNADLRAEMRALNFPVDDTVYQQLIGAVTTCMPTLGLSCPPSSDPQSFINGPFDVQVNGVVLSPAPCEPVSRIAWDWGDGTVTNSWFPASHTYSAVDVYTITVTALDASNIEIISDSCEVSLETIFKSGFE